MLVPITDGDYPAHYGVETALTYIWDVPTLSWVKNTGGGGGGGGAVTVADGADVAEGTTTDAAWTSGAGTVISLLKKIASAGGSAVSIADGSDVAEGTTSDSAWVSGNGTVIALLKTIASTGAAAGLTDAQLRATPVPVSGTVTTGGLTDAQLRAVAVPVSGTFFQGTQPVSGTFFQATQPVSAAALPLPAGAATSALQTQPGVDIGDVTVNNAAGGSAVNIQDGGNIITVDGTVAVTSAGLTNLDVALSTRLKPADTLTAVTTVTTVGAVTSITNPVSTKTDLTPAAPTAATVGVSSAQAVAANASRKGLILVNVSNNRISLGLGATAVLDSGITLYPGGVAEMDEYWFDLGAVNAIASAASSPLAIQELS